MADFWQTMDSLVTGGKEKKATGLAGDSIDTWSRLENEIPNLEDLTPEQYRWLQDLSPEKLNAGADVNYSNVDTRLADPSAMNDIAVDPRLQDTQMASLGALEDIASSGGLTMADQAALSKIQSEVGQADRGRREAIKQNMAQRGMGGSGMELLSMLDSSQAATDRASQSGLDIAGMAQQRALDAILQGGNMAGDIRGQDFGEQSQVAQANDAIAQFNAANMNQMNQFNAANQLNTNMYNRDTGIDVGKFNVTNANDAQKFNITGKQAAATGNTDLSNQAQLHNKFTAPQQQFDNKAGIAAGKSGAYADAAKLADTQANRRVEGTKDATAATMSGFGASDERLKKNVSSVSKEDVGEFLAAIQPKKYKYKDPEAPGQAEGDRIGFMLQDVQDTKLGKQITKKDDQGHMFFDKDNLDGIILAALSHLKKGA